jgi:AraC family transcriptional regulator
MLSVVAEIQTPIAKVEVMDGVWPQPVEHVWNDPRPVVTLLLRDSSYKAVGQYRNTGGSGTLEGIGSVFFIPPNCELYGWGSGGHVRAARCVFDKAFYERSAGAPGQLTSAQLRSSLNIRGSFAMTLLNRLMREALSPGFGSSMLAESLGAALLLESLGQTIAVHPELAAPRGSFTRRQRRIIDDYHEELETNPALNPPNISVLAERCGLGVRQFSRLFRQEKNESVGRYFSAVQIQRAQRMLIETDLSLKEIAFRLGFSSTANFSTAFRNACDQPPAAYRRYHQGIS